MKASERETEGGSMKGSERGGGIRVGGKGECSGGGKSCEHRRGAEPDGGIVACLVKSSFARFSEMPHSIDDTSDSLSSNLLGRQEG